MSLWVVLWFQLLQNLHLVRIETQPLLENLMHSCSWHLQFPWSPTNWLPWTSDECHMGVLYLLIGDTSASSVPFQEAPSLQKHVVPCFDALCVWCYFLINMTKLPLHPHNGLKLRKPHNSSHLLLSWRHLCVKWQQAPTVAHEVA
jgi:hypothetical protein